MNRPLNVEQLEDLGLDRDEAREVAVTQMADAAKITSASRICLDYLHTTHPDTGLDVVFVPGEALPDWALAVQEARNAPAPVEQPSKARMSLRASKEKGEPKPE